MSLVSGWRTLRCGEKLFLQVEQPRVTSTLLRSVPVAAHTALHRPPFDQTIFLGHCGMATLPREYIASRAGGQDAPSLARGGIQSSRSAKSSGQLQMHDSRPIISIAGSHNSFPRCRTPKFVHSGSWFNRARNPLS